MSQNRNKLIDLLIGHLANAVVHKILEQAAPEEYLRKYYDDELSNSIETAKGYRIKINPVNKPLPEKDAAEIREKVSGKAAAELNLRIAKGYKNINLELTKETAEKILAKFKVVSP